MRFFIIDTETTGFSTKHADIIEVSALEVMDTGNGYKVVREFDSYINPQYPLPEEIIEFNKKNNTGICDEFLADKPLAREVAENLFDFLGEEPVVAGHNVGFDVRFINKLYERNLGSDFTPRRVIDTLPMCKRRFAGSHKLSDIHQYTAKKYSKNLTVYHTSLADCYATLDILDYLNN